MPKPMKVTPKPPMTMFRMRQRATGPWPSGRRSRAEMSPVNPAKETPNPPEGHEVELPVHVPKVAAM